MGLFCLPCRIQTCNKNVWVCGVFCLFVRVSSINLDSVSFWIGIWLSVCLSVSVYVCLSVYVWLSLSMYVDVCLSVCLFVCLSVCLSISLSLTHIHSLSLPLLIPLYLLFFSKWDFENKRKCCVGRVDMLPYMETVPPTIPPRWPCG